MEIADVFRLLLSCPEFEKKCQIAGVCNVSPQALNCWKRIPSEHCRRLEYATGGKVTRYQMRPDIFGRGPEDWSDLQDDEESAAA